MTMTTAASFNRPIELLLVEDSPSDAGLTQAALAKAQRTINVHHVEDGVAAMEFLRRGAGYESSPRPDLILLDLNMPKMDGRQVLAEIREDAELQSLPVIILTTSGDPEDVVETYKLKANCYVQKPVDLTEFMSAIKSLDNFWFTYAALPLYDD